MAQSHRSDQILDEIDQLVEDSLSRGDQSDSFHGEQYDRCSLCGDHWHFLAITQVMAEMRNGSYGRDEFGVGLMDPAYRYSEDTSEYLCPGSTFKGPPTWDREWRWCKKHWKSYTPPGHSSRHSQRDSQLSERGPTQRNRGPAIRRWRFVGDWREWGIECTTDIEFRQLNELSPPEPISQRYFASFHHFNPLCFSTTQAAHNFIRENNLELREITLTPDGCFVQPDIIKFEYYRIELFGQQTDPNGNSIPEYVIFDTDYPIERHEWWMPNWELIDPSYQPEPLVIYDEAYEMSDQALQEAGFLPLGEINEEGITVYRGAPGPAQEASGQAGGPSVLRGTAQDPSGQDRQVDAQAQAGEVQGAPRPADVPGDRSPEEAGGA